MHTTNEDPLADYRATLWRERLKLLGALAAFLLGAPIGAVVGFAANRALLGAYGGEEMLVFVISGALACGFGLFGLVRLATRALTA